jgi:hypothetical protein
LNTPADFAVSRIVAMGDNYDWMGNVQPVGLHKKDWRFAVISLSAVSFSFVILAEGYADGSILSDGF